MKIEQMFYEELKRSSQTTTKPIIEDIDQSYKSAISECTNRHKIMVAAYHNSNLLIQLLPNLEHRESFHTHMHNMFERYKTLKSAPNMQTNMSNFFDKVVSSQAPF